MTLDNVCKVSIHRGSKQISRAGFSLMNLVAAHVNFLERMKYYASLTAVEADFDTSSDVYNAASRVFEQDNAPARIAIGRIGVNKVRFTVQAETNGQVAVGNIFKLKGKDKGDSSFKEFSHTAAEHTYATVSVTTGVAGAAEFSFTGNAADAARFLEGYTFEYSGDTTSAANGTYTVSEGGATLADGTVTIPVDEAISAATDNGQIDVADDKIAVCAALKVAHTASTLSSRCTDNADGTIDFQPEVDGQEFVMLADDVSRLASSIVTLGETGADDAARWKTGLTEIKKYANDWYGLIALSRTKAIQIAVSQWTESNSKFFFMCSNEDAIENTAASSDTTSIAAQLSAVNYSRTMGIFRREAGTADEEWFDAGLMAVGMSYDLDKMTFTYKFKTVKGCTAETYDDTQLTNISAKNFNYYHEIAGVSILDGYRDGVHSGGVVVGGEYTDIVIGIDWLSIRIQEADYATKVSLPKIPLDNSGIATIISGPCAVMQKAIETQFLMFDDSKGKLGFGVEYPDRSELTAAQVQNREVPISLHGTPAGAIHITDVDIYLS